MRLRQLAALATPLLIGSLAATGCSASPGGTADGRLQVLTSFYPLQFVAEQVGGDLVDVENLTPLGADPHELELSPARAREIGLADVVVYLSALQPAVDDAIAQRKPANVVDAADYVKLLPASVTGNDEVEEPESGDESAHTEDEDDGHDHDHDHDHGMSGNDPHFWLDPTRLARITEPVADALAKADPAHAEKFAANAADLTKRLDALDQEFAKGLAPYAGATLITNHTAFGYLAQRYGLEQIGITGLDDSTEPSPARLREIGQLAHEHHVSTLFYETLASPRVVEILASDQGLKSAVLDTLEGLTKDNSNAGDDYISIMQHNLKTLQEGLVAP